MSLSDTKSSFQEIIYDLGAVCTLLAAGLEEQHPRSGDVVSAKDHVTSANLAKALNSPLGIELMAPVEALEQQGLQDEVGDDSFRAAQGVFADPQFFRARINPLAGDGLEEGVPRYALVLRNLRMLKGQPMVLTTVLLDAMSRALDALSSWTSRRLREREADVLEFAEDVARTMAGMTLDAACKLARATAGLFSHSQRGSVAS